MIAPRLGTLAFLAGFALLACGGTAGAVDARQRAGLPDLEPARALIKARDFPAAVTELRGLANGYGDDADVCNLLGFALRKTGDYAGSLSWYTRALELDPKHKSAREYLGELYVETGRMEQARAQLAVLEQLCPQGCEEREDLEKAIAAKAGQ